MLLVCQLINTMLILTLTSVTVSSFWSVQLIRDNWARLCCWFTSRPNSFKRRQGLFIYKNCIKFINPNSSTKEEYRLTTLLFKRVTNWTNDDMCLMVSDRPAHNNVAPHRNLVLHCPASSRRDVLFFIYLSFFANQ